MDLHHPIPELIEEIHKVLAEGKPVLLTTLVATVARVHDMPDRVRGNVMRLWYEGKIRIRIAQSELERTRVKRLDTVEDAVYVEAV